MDWFSKAFLKSSLAWFGVGVTLGAVMSSWPNAAAYRTAHFHMNLLGFVSMMIFGVAYHVIPRFMGHPLHDKRLAAIHFYVANVGLATLSVGFLLVPTLGAPRAIPVQAAGGTLDLTAPLQEIPVFALIEALAQVLGRSKVKLTHDVTLDRLSLAEKINELTERLDREMSFTFESCFDWIEKVDAVIHLRGQLVVTTHLLGMGTYIHTAALRQFTHALASIEHRHKQLVICCQILRVLSRLLAHPVQILVITRKMHRRPPWLPGDIYRRKCHISVCA